MRDRLSAAYTLAVGALVDLLQRSFDLLQPCLHLPPARCRDVLCLDGFHAREASDGVIWRYALPRRIGPRETRLDLGFEGFELRFKNLLIVCGHRCMR